MMREDPHIGPQFLFPPPKNFFFPPHHYCRATERELVETQRGNCGSPKPSCLESCWKTNSSDGALHAAWTLRAKGQSYENAMDGDSRDKKVQRDVKPVFFEVDFIWKKLSEGKGKRCRLR